MDFHNDRTRLSLKALQMLPQMYGRDCRAVRWAFAYRRLRNALWWGWRRRVLSCIKKGPPKDGRLHVFWHLRGGLGDCAAARLAVLVLRAKLPAAVFYYHTDSPSAASALFVEDEKNIFLPAGQPLWYKYDVAFETCQSFKTVHVNRARVQKTAPEFLPLLDEMAKRQNELAFFLSDNYLMEDLLGRFAVEQKLPRAALLSYLSGTDFDPLAAPPLPPQLTDGARLARFGLQGKKYITFHDGIDATFHLHDRRPLKSWPEKNWRELARLLKEKYSDITLVQLGGKNSPKYDFADVCLVGQTCVADLPALLNHTLLHIDGESGLVQLARFLQSRCLVLFGPTDKDFFGLSKNINLKENACGSCMWLLGTAWHVTCALGYKTCRNMDALTPEKVFRAACGALDEVLK